MNHLVSAPMQSVLSVIGAELYLWPQGAFGVRQ